jgi:hypothetical protein
LGLKYSAEMTFFTKAQDVFEIPGRGAVLVLPKDWGTDLKIRLGENIQLRTPDGRVFDTRIRGIEMIRTVSGGLAGIMLPNEVPLSDLSPQTEIWLSER